MSNIRGIGIELKSSLWFLPALCVLFATGLAVGLVEVDLRSGAGSGLAQHWPQFFGLSAEGSRSILAAIAQSVITVAGVTFSITIVALSITANQYSPRVLRNFMRDRGNQLVLGGLVGIFTYCIIVLRTIHGGEKSFIPAIAVMMALVLAIAAIGLFIYFIHHVATSIQASSIICSIATETKQVIRSLPAERAADELPECGVSTEEERALSQIKWRPVAADTSGYLQSVDSDALVAFARKHRVVLRMECAIGDFVLENRPLVAIGSDWQPDRQTLRGLTRLFTIQSYRTIDQDLAFGIRQIVDIAVKALSPGINDPTTATTCLDYLASILELLIGRPIPPICRYEEGKLCLVSKQPSFGFLLDLAFNEIRQNSGSQPVVLMGLLAAIEKVAAVRSDRPERLQLLAEHVKLVLGMAEQRIRFLPDLARVRGEARRLEAGFRGAERAANSEMGPAGKQGGAE